MNGFLHVNRCKERETKFVSIIYNCLETDYVLKATVVFYIKCKVQTDHSNFHLENSIFAQCSVDNSYRLVIRGYLFLGQDYLLQEAGNPGGRPKKTMSQLDL